MPAAPPIACEDWRRQSADEIAPLLEAEARAWRERLDWDVAGSWRPIEPARAAGTLPGFVARDPDGRIAGWTWFLEHLGSLQVAALVADRPDVVRVLVEAVLSSDAAARAAACVWCVRGGAPDLADTLRRCGGDVTRYLYLSAPTRAGDATRAGLGLRRWRDDDVDAIAALFARAYAPTDQVRAFAPRGTLEEWRAYVQSLRCTTGCGRFLAQASVVVPAAIGVGAATVITEIAADTAHLAQIAVDPAIQQQGWGRRLAAQALRSAAGLGYQRLTLLVADGNARARAIYARLGFTARETFVIAVARQPRRLTSVAPASGGASTRR